VIVPPLSPLTLDELDVRGLFVGIITRAVSDCKGNAFYVEPRRRARVRWEAWLWLRSDLARSYAQYVGVPADQWHRQIAALERPCPPSEVAS
jgi:hypothetical protein